MDRGAWRGYSPWGLKESDTTEQLTRVVIVIMKNNDLCQYLLILMDVPFLPFTDIPVRCVRNLESGSLRGVTEGLSLKCHTAPD